MPKRHVRFERSHSVSGPHKLQAIAALKQAREYARDDKCDIWEYAIGILELLALGINPNYLRRLLRDGLIEHGLNHTPPTARQRLVRKVSNLRFTEQSSFVLTDAGLAVAQQQRIQSRKKTPPDKSSQRKEIPKPRWDRNARALFVGEKLVKQFKEPAPNQETVLSALEEDAWPRRIDDPLPPSKNVDCKKRLHDAIVRLNRHQVHPLLRFRGDGTGQGVRWEYAKARRSPR